MIIDKIRRLIKPGTLIPKPESGEEYIVKGWGVSRGEKALVYFIPKKPKTKHQSSRRIPISDFERAYDVLMKTGEFTKDWYLNNLKCSKDGDCNYTTIGGIFILIGIAERGGQGLYILKQ